MNPTMKAASQVIKKARALVSECGYCKHDTNLTVVPEAYFDELVEALDDYEVLGNFDREDDEDAGIQTATTGRLKNSGYY